MAKRLTDRQKKKIIADYVSCENYAEVARKHGVHASTVRRLTAGNKEMHEKARQKKEQNTLDMLAYMESKQGEAQLFIDACMLEMLKPGRLESARLSEITTAMGTVIDKFTQASQFNENATQKLDKLLEGIDHAAKS